MNSILRHLLFGLSTGLFLTAAMLPAEANGQLGRTAQHAVKQSNRFSDVGDDYWAKPFIDALAADGYVSGYDDGRFRPDQQLTRAEFAAMLKQAFADAPELKPASAAFADVSSVVWALPAIDFVESRGFMSGIGQGRFDPSSDISRVQVIVAFSSGLDLEPIDDTEMFLASNYTDITEIPFWAYSQATAATMNEVVVNPQPVTMPTQLEPNRAATRAEVAAMVYQALARENKIAPLSAANRATTHIVGF